MTYLWNKYGTKCALTFGLAARVAFADIIGGEEVETADPVAASTVGIYTPSPNGSGGSLCTGSLIRKDIAITAAHCIAAGGQFPTVIFGRDLQAPGVPRRGATGVVVNKKWGRASPRGLDQGDVALVKFPGGLPEGYHQIPAAQTEGEVQPGDVAVLAGYGISDRRTQSGAGRLRKTQVTVLKNRPGKSEMILDQSHGRGACHGDSGGPAFVNHNGRTVLVGVTNRSYPNRAPDDCAHKVLYTKVGAYRSWIERGEKRLEHPGSSRSPVLLNQSVRLARAQKKKTRRIRVTKTRSSLRRGGTRKARKVSKTS